MNKGLKNYTKQLKFDNGLVKAYVNLNKNDANTHLIVPLIETDGPSPISLSLIYNHQDRNESSLFGKGFKLNSFASIQQGNDQLSVKNADGSTDIFVYDNSIGKYKDVTTGGTVETTSVSEEYSAVQQYYKFSDLNGNTTQYRVAEKYPATISMKSGARYNFDFVSLPYKITTNTNDTVTLYKTGNYITRVVYKDTVVQISYVNNIISNISYSRGETEFGNISFDLTNSSIYLADSFSFKTLSITMNDLNNTYEIDENIMDCDIEHITNITYHNRETVIQDFLGRTTRVVFDEADFPSYVINSDGVVVAEKYDHDIKKELYRSAPIDAIHNLTNLLPSNSIDFINLENVTSSVITLPQNSAYSEIIGNSLRRLVVGNNYSYNRASISTRGIAGDSFTIVLWGRCTAEGTTTNSLSISINGEDSRSSASKTVTLRKDGLFDFVSVGFTAKDSFDTMRILLQLSKNCTFEIGGLQLIKKAFGVEYKYDDNGNLKSITQNGENNSITYDTSTNLPSGTQDSNRIVYSFEYDNKGNLLTTSGAYCVKTENTYSNSTVKKLLSSKTTNKDSSKVLKTSQTYDSNYRYVTSSTDELGNVTQFTNIDVYGSVGKIIYANNNILDSTYNDGLLTVLKLMKNQNVLMSANYTYDSLNRLVRVNLANSSSYEFDYDCANNLTEIRLNSMAIYMFEYDLSRGNLIKQTYGDGSSFIFTYNADNLLSAIYYSNSTISSYLRYQYIYNDRKQLVSILDGSSNLLVNYVYDNEGNLIEEYNADFTLKREVANDGAILSTKFAVDNKEISQSYSHLSQSKSFNPDSLATICDNDYFGEFTKDSHLRSRNTIVYNIYDIVGTSNSFLDNGVPAVNIDQNNLIGYAFDPNYAGDDFYGTFMLWFKPHSISNNENVFYILNQSNMSRLCGKISNGKLKISVTNRNGTTSNVVTTSTSINSNEWNFLAVYFGRRYDGQGYDDERKLHLILNQEIKIVPSSQLGLFATCDFNCPIYAFAHETTISGTPDNPQLTPSNVLNADISCLLITNRYGTSIKEMQKFYNETKLYIMDMALKESNLDAVDFTLTTLHSTNDNFNNEFTFYPLQNSVKSTNGDKPLRFSYRDTYSKQTGKSFAFDRETKGYAYVADGAELVFETTNSISKTILMKMYLDPSLNSYYSETYPNDTTKTRRYLFDMCDENNNCISLGLDEEDKLIVSTFGVEHTFDFTFNRDEWYTVAFTYGTENGNKTCKVCINSTNTYTFIDNSNGSYQTTPVLSIGRKYIPYDSEPYNFYNEVEYYPLYGQIKSLAISDNYHTQTELIDLLTNLTEISRVHMYDEMGMLKKVELKDGTTNILTNSYTYKSQADIDLANQSNDNTQELSKYISPIVKSESIESPAFNTTRVYDTDVMGNITSIQDSEFGNHSYTYDDRGFLASADGENYQYDANGNITKIGSTQMYYHSRIKDKLVRVGNNNIIYDLDVSLNPAEYNGCRFYYEGRRLSRYLPSSTGFTSTAYRYVYNEKGLRIKKIKDVTLRSGAVQSIVTKYFYDGNNLISQVTAGFKIDFLYDENGQLYGLNYNGTKYFYIKDQLQNILGIVDKDGEIVVKYNYTGYGRVTTTGSLATTVGQNNPFRFKGYYYDTESGMYYCLSRYYVPEWGRWLNADHPNYIDSSSLNSSNLFTYCANNPINRCDHNGKFWFTFITTVVGGVVGSVVSVINAVIAQKEITWKTVIGGFVEGSVAGFILGLSKGTAIAAASYASAAAGSIFNEIWDYASGEKELNSINVLKSFASVAIDTTINGTVNYICNKTMSKIPFLKTNPGWFIPKTISSYFFGKYGQKMLGQCLIGGAENVYLNSLLVPLKHYAYELIDYWFLGDPIESL